VSFTDNWLIKKGKKTLMKQKKTIKLEIVWEEERIRHNQNLMTEQKPNMMLWGFVYFIPINFWVKPVSDCNHSSFTTTKTVLGKQFWPQSLRLFSSVALSTLFSLVLFHSWYLQTGSRLFYLTSFYFTLI